MGALCWKKLAPSKGWKIEDGVLYVWGHTNWNDENS